MADYLVVGLGNPGPKYAASRHNIGAACVNRLAQRNGVVMRTSSLAQTGHVSIAGFDVLLVRPRTWYNGTGRAVDLFMRRERVAIERVIAVYDELELPEGQMELLRDASDRGNNGLRSIGEAAGSSDFGLIAIGIGHPRYDGVPPSDMVIRHVLAVPAHDARLALEQAIERACSAVGAIVGCGWKEAMRTFNREVES